MLKSTLVQETICVRQMDHGSVAGFLAAHWGNDVFHQPGFLPATTASDRLRAEILFGIAEHDNGWLEWEASPSLDTDGLPHELFDALSAQYDEMERWRLGMRRFQDQHPYASLMTSYHISWLYAIRCGHAVPDEFRHPLWWNRDARPFAPQQREVATEFLQDVLQEQKRLVSQLKGDRLTATWVDAPQLQSAVRLLQILDAMSLALCSGVVPDRNQREVGPGQSHYTLSHVPRQLWDDRVSIDVFPVGDNRVACHPFPFDRHELEVIIPIRRFSSESLPVSDFASAWYEQRPENLRFVLVDPERL